jgi:hypothetical protein
VSAAQPRGPDEHKALAQQLGLRSVRDLLVLAPDNDPWFKGRPAHWRDAHWFAGLWERFGYTTGMHLRRIHYQILSTGQTTPTGEPYENTEGCWTMLCLAGAAARILGLVDPEAFADRRNDPPRLHVQPRWEQPAPSCDVPPWERPTWELPAIDRSTLEVDGWALPAIRSWQLEAGASYWFTWPAPDVDGYDYHPADQPVLLELWVEKSTMDDVLVPVCRDLHANLLSGAGFESISAAVSLLRRAQAHGKPAHVLYVADYDPAGVHMPTAVARQLQYWRDALGVDVPVTLEQVALTAEQVRQYDLPRTPIKESDRRAARFQERNGAGAVELDALEALHPGTLRNVAWRAMQPYVDGTLPLRLADAERQAASEAASALAEVTTPLDEQLAEVETNIEAVTDGYRERVRALNAELRGAMAPYQERLDELRADVDDALTPFRERLAALADELADELAPHRERLDELAEEAASTVDEFEPELPPRAEPAAPEVDGSALLFDSERPWLEQLHAFKARQNGSGS